MAKLMGKEIQSTIDSINQEIFEPPVFSFSTSQDKPGDACPYRAAPQAWSGVVPTEAAA